jgi:hypothetical protein
MEKTYKMIFCNATLNIAILVQNWAFFLNIVKRITFFGGIRKTVKKYLCTRKATAENSEHKYLKKTTLSVW